MNSKSKQLENQNILFLLRAESHGGNENVVVQLCNTLSPLVKNIVICSAGGFNKNLLNLDNVSYYTIPDIENKHLKNIKKVWKTICHIMKEENITIVHTHHRMAALYACILRVMFSFISINTMHTVFYDKKMITRFILNRTNVVACGNRVRDNLISYYKVNPQRVAVIQNGVRAFKGEIIPIDELISLRNEGFFLVGSVGRLSPEKGVEYFVRAIPLVDTERVKYVIVGDGSEREKLKELTIELGVGDKVLFLGYRNDVQNVIAQLDFIVLSSLQEGLPLVPMEAFSVSKTVIATSIEGTTEIIKDGYNGILVEPGDSRGLAKKIRWLLDNEKKRKMLETNAVRDYEKYFSISVFQNKYLRYYKALLTG